MSMTWMRAPEQTWAGLAASFLGMWTVMMVAMMLPSLVPVLRRYRCAIGGDGGNARVAILTTLVALCYFLVWAGCGAVAFALGVGLTSIAMHSPMLAVTAPLAGSAAILLAGGVQCSGWKINQLACCRTVYRPHSASASGATAAMRHGLCLGLHCVCCCCGLTVVLLVAGLMDLRAMAVVTAAVTLERLAPRGERIARIIGGIVIGIGLLRAGTFQVGSAAHSQQIHNGSTPLVDPLEWRRPHPPGAAQFFVSPPGNGSVPPGSAGLDN